MRRTRLILIVSFFILSVSILGTLQNSAAQSTQSETPSIVIDASAPRVEISPDLYGIFYEEISRAGEGGLSAELVQNRDFEATNLPEGWTQDGTDIYTAKGRHYNQWWDTDNPAGAYVNVLIDWNRDGEWGGFDVCPNTTGAYASEHILRNFHVPVGNGYLSTLDPPDFQIGTHTGFVWARFTITTDEITGIWHGEGDFPDGETEDHLVWVGSAHVVQS